ncbi:hypothetical protein SAMN02745131_04204 [Flavisolibacter ginsengisoli DSM 18119]|jgi:hypothetical protein|uniref:Uncharacterized protein n=1 Tax=Flavisolibacter ginsengisoli DSM 18119 TaxID=1121884 RepID=A0A1M5GPX5_9BACT|nr:hypothetical protein SAMN02745131_04204 [Flavisolibacter ginsengisoli DSM 18119]
MYTLLFIHAHHRYIEIAPLKVRSKDPAYGGMTKQPSLHFALKLTAKPYFEFIAIVHKTDCYYSLPVL